jgi:YcxB-like protein
MTGFDGEPAFRLRWHTERDDVREAVAWDLRHSRRLKKLRVGYGLGVVLLGLGAWVQAPSGELGTVAVVAAAAVVGLVMVATLPVRLRRAAWRATSQAPKELLVYAEGLMLSRDGTQLRLPWSEVSGIDETPRLLLLTLTGSRPGMMFPKRGLGDPAAVPRLRKYLAARVGPRATRAGGGHTTPSA